MSKLYFYYSAMNAGKSTTLLQSSYNYRERGMNTLIFTPDFDDRFGAGKVASRIGLQSDAIPFNSGFNFYSHVKDTIENKTIHCVLVDEAQFLKKHQVESLIRICDYLRIPVLAYGLRSNYHGEAFEGSQYLLIWADELKEIKTICHCGKKASMNMLIDAEGNKTTMGPDILIGGNDKYVSTCRKHFWLGDSGKVAGKRTADKEEVAT